jgi:hypothetical protein
MLLVGSHTQTEAQTIGIGAHRARFIIVFVDETGSRASAWDAMVDKIAKVASRLKNHDAFTVIGIDDHGGDEDDVRIPLTVIQTRGDLDVAGLNAQRNLIVQQVKSLKPRRNPQRTDIVGAIRQAQGLANKVSQNMNVVLAFFSDMQQTPRMPDPASFNGIHFPEGTLGYCFYVAASKRFDFPATVHLWKPLLNSAGITITENDFNQQGSVDFGLNNAFKQ